MWLAEIQKNGGNFGKSEKPVTQQNVLRGTSMGVGPSPQPFHLDAPVPVRANRWAVCIFVILNSWRGDYEFYTAY